MNNLLQTASNYFVSALSGWDWLVAGVIVLIVEYAIKRIFKADNFKWLWKVSPILLGVVGYLIYSLVTKNVWYQGILRGFEVGLIAIGYYDVILKTVKESGKQGLENTNTAIKDAVTKS